jgi:hypothetical protein
VTVGQPVSGGLADRNSQPVDAAIRGPVGSLDRAACLRAVDVLGEFLRLAACLGTVRSCWAMLTLSGRDLPDAAHSPGQDQGSASAPGSDALAVDLGAVSLSVRWSHERAASTKSYRMYS